MSARNSRLLPFLFSIRFEINDQLVRKCLDVWKITPDTVLYFFKYIIQGAHLSSVQILRSRERVTTVFVAWDFFAVVIGQKIRRFRGNWSKVTRYEKNWLLWTGWARRLFRELLDNEKRRKFSTKVFVQRYTQLPIWFAQKYVITGKDKRIFTNEISVHDFCSCVFMFTNRKVSRSGYRKTTSTFATL